MKLNYQIIGTGQPLVIVHGLFGSSDNWRSLAKQLSEKVQLITIDLRNHGRSPHSSELSYALMADDLAELLDDLNLTHVDMLGHSIGGKVVMAFSQRYPDRLRKIMVVDIAPKQYEEEHTELFKALLAVDLIHYSKRSEVDDELEKTVVDKTVRQFLLMNLVNNDGKLSWRINLQGLFEHYHDLLQAVCVGETITVPCCFIRGGRSSYIVDDDKKLIKSIYPNSEIITIEQAGHWVHVEAPHIFLVKITEFFNYD